MPEEKLRDKLTKVMAERRSGNIQPSAETEAPPALPEQAPADEANAEWKAFYESIKAYMNAIRE